MARSQSQSWAQRLPSLHSQRTEELRISPLQSYQTLQQTLTQTTSSHAIQSWPLARKTVGRSTLAQSPPDQSPFRQTTYTISARLIRLSPHSSSHQRMVHSRLQRRTLEVLLQARSVMKKELEQIVSMTLNASSCNQQRDDLSIKTLLLASFHCKKQALVPKQELVQQCLNRQGSI